MEKNKKKIHQEYIREWNKKNKEKKKETNSRYRRKNKDKINEYNRKMNKIWNDEQRFGGNRIKALERDNFECQCCGMTQEQHFLIFSRGLTVDHIDGNGRNTKCKNNNLENLKTLCLRCHGKKDGGRR